MLMLVLLVQTLFCASASAKPEDLKKGDLDEAIAIGNACNKQARQWNRQEQNKKAREKGWDESTPLTIHPKTDVCNVKGICSWIDDDDFIAFKLKVVGSEHIACIAMISDDSEKYNSRQIDVTGYELQGIYTHPLYQGGTGTKRCKHPDSTADKKYIGYGCLMMHYIHYHMSEKLKEMQKKDPECDQLIVWLESVDVAHVRRFYRGLGYEKLG